MSRDAAQPKQGRLITGRLIVGRVYDPQRLRLFGWTKGDGSGHKGYSVKRYFADGRYKGPDQHGIEPIFDFA